MMPFAAFALFITVAVAMLVIWPILLHPTMPRAKKTGLTLVCFLLIVPGGIALYAWLGVPQLAQ